MKQELFNKLRSKHEKIIYHDYDISFLEGFLEIKYKFELTDGIIFYPTVKIPSAEKVITKVVDRFIFLAGIVELISYWKLSCPWKIEILAGHLSEKEIEWFKVLYRKGLGEFFYVNQLDPNMKFQFYVGNCNKSELPETIIDSDTKLVMVGGGKDSLVSLKILKENRINVKGFFLNPIPNSIIGFDSFGFDQKLILERRISPSLLELNKQEYLNGHTPFSALLSFYAVITAMLNNCSEVITSNESTANEANVLYEGLEINHQFSKTFEYEKMFLEISNLNSSPVKYYSLLRPINELQITGILSTDDNLLNIFLSCNRAQTIISKKEKSFKWCGECPKCIFTFLCLSCFLKVEKCFDIISDNIFNSEKFITILMELIGKSSHKSLECVGSFEESSTAFLNLLKKIDDKNNISIDKLSSDKLSEFRNLAKDIVISNDLLNYWDENNFLSEEFKKVIKNKVSLINYV